MDRPSEVPDERRRSHQPLSEDLREWNAQVNDDTWTQVERLGLVWFWDPDGRPIPLRDWSDLFAHREQRGLVWVTVVPGASPDRVTTAYLGDNAGEPLPPGQEPSAVWGTLIGSREVHARTREQAVDDHRAQVRLLYQQTGIPRCSDE